MSLNYFTWCYRTPGNTPTRPCIIAISSENKVDNMAPASDFFWEGGMLKLASNHDAMQGRATALLQQDCPVTVCDCQVVAGTVGTRRRMFLNVKCSESQ